MWKKFTFNFAINIENYSNGREPSGRTNDMDIAICSKQLASHYCNIASQYCNVARKRTSGLTVKVFYYIL